VGHLESEAAWVDEQVLLMSLRIRSCQTREEAEVRAGQPRLHAQTLALYILQLGNDGSSVVRE